MIKCACYSDTHGNIPDIVDDVQLAIFAGDFVGIQPNGNPFSTDNIKHQIIWTRDIFLPFLQKFKCPVVLTAGNHEFFLDSKICSMFGVPSSQNWLRKNLPSNVTYLNRQSAVVNGIKVWGSPWTPWFYDWAFNYPKAKGDQFAKQMYSTIQQGTQIIVTHGPPRGILDQGKDGGCCELLKVISKNNCKLACFGHFHSRGCELINGITFVNAAMAGPRNNGWNTPLLHKKPIIVQI